MSRSTTHRRRGSGHLVEAQAEPLVGDDGPVQPETALHRVTSHEDLEILRQRLFSTERRPLVVCSIAGWAEEPEVDVSELLTELQDVAELWVLPAQATFWLSDSIGKAFSVHSGWVRVYPPGDLTNAPLVRPGSDRRRTTRRVVDLAIAASAGVPSAPQGVLGRHTTAVVRDVVSPTQALVQTDEGETAIMRTPILFPGLPATRLVAPSQRFSGSFRPVGLMGEFTADPVEDDPRARALEFVGDGVTTSALCTRVRRGRALLQLHPAVELEIAGGAEDLRTLVAPGDVVTIDVVEIDGILVAEFSSGSPSPAMPVLPGGPPWLEPEPVMESSAPEEEPAADQEVARRQALQVEDQQRSQLTELMAELDRLETIVSEKESTIRRLRAELRRSTRLSVPVVYADPEAQFRFEVHLSYLGRVEEASRDQFPWPERFRISEGFLESVARLVDAGGITREKIVEVCADVLCGRAYSMPSRAVKPWTDGTHGPQLRRDDGASAFRVRLQSQTAAARRLRFWLLANGEIELDTVGVHDAGTV